MESLLLPVLYFLGIFLIAKHFFQGKSFWQLTSQTAISEHYLERSHPHATKISSLMVQAIFLLDGKQKILKVNLRAARLVPQSGSPCLWLFSTLGSSETCHVQRASGSWLETKCQVTQMAALILYLPFRFFSFLFSLYSRVCKPIGAQESICLSNPESDLQQLLSHSKLKGPHRLQLPEFTQHSCGQPWVSEHQPVSPGQDSLWELSLLDPGGQPPNKPGQSWLPAGLLTEGNQT